MCQIPSISTEDVAGELAVFMPMSWNFVGIFPSGLQHLGAALHRAGS
jgi:hypothetical protein